MKTMYFLLTEDEDSVVGVIAATSNEELSIKAKIAIDQHFDTDIPVGLKLDMEDYMYGRMGQVSVDTEFDNDPEYKATITIQQTWLY